jgi:cell division protein FtsB
MMKEGAEKSERMQRGLVLGLALFCAALTAHSIFGTDGWLALRRQKGEYQSLRKQIRQLRDENSALENQIHNLQTNPKAIEHYARAHMHLARPREIILTLPKDSKELQPDAAAHASARANP